MFVNIPQLEKIKDLYRLLANHADHRSSIHQSPGNICWGRVANYHRRRRYNITLSHSLRRLDFPADTLLKYFLFASIWGWTEAKATTRLESPTVIGGGFHC